MSEQRINEYIEGKYGKFGVDRYAAYFCFSSSLFVLAIFLHSSQFPMLFVPKRGGDEMCV